MAKKPKTPKKETPTPSKASGASSEQNELFDLPTFCPNLPPRGSAAEQALDGLLARDLTQLEWLTEGSGWVRPIALYSLSAKAKQAAFSMRQGGASA